MASPIYHYAEVAKTECNENQTECSHRCNMNFVKYKNIPDVMVEENYYPFCQGRIENRKYQIQIHTIHIMLNSINYVTFVLRNIRLRNIHIT